MPISKRTRRGTFWVLFVGLLISVTPRVLMHTLYAEDPVHLSHYRLMEIHDELLQAAEESGQAGTYPEKKQYNAPPSKFDPNTYSLSDWMKLGVSRKQAEVILKFSARGLKSNEDLKRIFTLPAGVYELIRDSTYYPQTNTPDKHHENKPREAVLIDINKAGAEELTRIPGIGTYFAGKIVAYRDKLGGFVALDQLLEIWKFDQDKLDQVEPFMFLGDSEPRKLNINEADYESLKAHPYISYEVANSIVKMRMQAPYTKVEDILRSKLIDKALLEKLNPYLSAE